MPKAPPTRKELQALARLRLQEAEALFSAGLFDGAVYLAGYAVELALKARICRLLKVSRYLLDDRLYRSYKTHDLDALKVLAGLAQDMTPAKNAALFVNWSSAIKWDPEQRYDAPGKYDAGAAKDIIDSITARPNGVFTWLTRRW